MEKFDIMNCVGMAYQSVWRERQSILKIGFILFAVKIASHIYIITQIPDAELLRQTLYRLPDYFVEGWFIAGFLNLLAFGDKSFTLPFGKAESREEVGKKKRIQAAIILYVIIQLVFNAYNYGVFQIVPNVPMSSEVEVSPVQTLGLAVAILMVVFLFRFLWLHVPMALGVRLSDFISKTHRPLFSIKLFGAWLVCIIPISFLFLGVMGLVVDPYIDDLKAAPLGIKFLMVLSQSLFEIIMALVQAATVYFAIFYDRFEKELS